MLNNKQALNTFDCVDCATRDRLKTPQPIEVNYIHTQQFVRVLIPAHEEVVRSVLRCRAHADGKEQS